METNGDEKQYLADDRDYRAVSLETIDRCQGLCWRAESVIRRSMSGSSGTFLRIHRIHPVGGVGPRWSQCSIFLKGCRHSESRFRRCAVETHRITAADQIVTENPFFHENEGCGQLPGGIEPARGVDYIIDFHLFEAFLETIRAKSVYG